MSEDKAAKTSPASIPEAEYAEPSWAAVEPDEIASVRLLVQVGILSVFIVLIMLGLWRFLKWQTSDTLKGKEAKDANNQALILQRDAQRVIQARTPHPTTMRARIPVRDAIGQLVKNPALFQPLSRIPGPAAGMKPAMAPPPRTPVEAPAMAPTE